MTGLPVSLRFRPFAGISYDVPIAAIWDRSVACEIAGVPARILSPADNLIHVWGVAATSPTRENFRWIADTWYIMAQHRDLDWGAFMHTINGPLVLPVSVILEYLRDALDAPVPADIITSLNRAAAETDATDREAALLGALTGLRSTRRTLFQIFHRWPVRVQLLRLIVLPSPEWLSGQYKMRTTLLLPLLYLHRPIAYALPRLWHLIGHRTRAWFATV